MDELTKTSYLYALHGTDSLGNAVSEELYGVPDFNTGQISFDQSLPNIKTTRITGPFYKELWQIAHDFRQRREDNKEVSQ